MSIRCQEQFKTEMGWIQGGTHMAVAGGGLGAGQGGGQVRQLQGRVRARLGGQAGAVRLGFLTPPPCQARTPRTIQQTVYLPLKIYR